MGLSLSSIKKNLKKFNIKSIIGSVIFAIILWLFVSLNESYITWVQIPLLIELPPNRALEKSPEPSVFVEVKGTGWQLFSLLSFNTSARCYLNLNKANFNNDVFIVSKDELIKSAELMKNIEVKNVRPETVQIFTGQISQKKVPVIPDIQIIPAEGFTVVGKLKITPDSVIIKGNSKIIQEISSWKTEKIQITDKIKSFDFNIGLMDSLKNIISINPASVNIYVNIQQSAQKVIPDVAIKVIGKQLPQNYIIQPPKISVILTGGIEEIKKVTPSDVSAFIYYNDIITDSIGIFKPEIKFPENIKLLNTDPKTVQIIKQTK